jgi:hypothetical protein
MRRVKLDTCPFDAATRASKCEGCCARNAGMPPCVAAWLASRAGSVELLQPAPANVFEFKPLLRVA